MPLSAGASVGLTWISIQSDACVATCPETIALGRARNPSRRGATSAGAGDGLTCIAIQCAPVDAAPPVQVRAMACHALPYRTKPAPQLAQINRHRTRKKSQ